MKWLDYPLIESVLMFLVVCAVGVLSAVFMVFGLNLLMEIRHALYG